MFYRRKILLSLLHVFGGTLEKINLYKLTFILTKKQVKPEYEFVPYKLGCYSFSLNADLNAMGKREQVRDEGATLRKIDPKDYFTGLTEIDKKSVLGLYKEFKSFSTEDLMRHTYIHYPYTAINSNIAETLLSPAEYEAVNNYRPACDETVLFTIGYEGISLEAYLNKLVLNDIKVLVDVRSNPLSQKFGFSKSLLQRYCNSLDIEYIHFPEVGIQGRYRQELHTQSDYDLLFKKYNEDILATNHSSKEKILNLLIKKRRIALTCFEANICQCHRKHLAEAIIKLPNWKFELRHI